jgi:DNA-directed RNA polymerase subunit M/transcription elongation factor TFIIS
MSNLDLIKQNINNKLKFVIPIELYKDESYNKLRRSIILLISELIYKYNNINEFLNYDKINDIIIRIELSCYNHTINKSNELMYIKSWDNTKFEYLYRLYTNKVTKNLDIDSEVNSKYLLTQIINNNIDIDNIAILPSAVLCPEKSINIINKLTVRSNQKLVFKKSNLYTCRNCKKKCVTIEQVQIRALDESSSFSLTCAFCQYNWIV